MRAINLSQANLFVSRFKRGLQLCRPMSTEHHHYGQTNSNQVACRLSSNPIRLLSQNEAIALDQELFTEYAFSVDQLMELAGLSVAQVIAKCYPKQEYGRPLICVGPGNNGGDGLVAARHLKLFGYEPTIVCPKQPRSSAANNQLYQRLLIQCRKFHINLLVDDQVPQSQELFDKLEANLLVDAVFGFSFKPPNRSEMFAKLLQQIHQYSKRVPLLSIDIPSGWHVDNAYQSLQQEQDQLPESLRIPILEPDCLVSLTAPKLCSQQFKGRRHYLGGRFCPSSLARKYQLDQLESIYKGTDNIVALRDVALQIG